MVNENTNVTESTEEVKQVVEESQNVPEAPENATPETPEEPEWKPDYSFKVRDNVHEFDEEIRPLVTKENHAKIKELYEKAYGLDYAKKRLDTYDEEFKSKEQQLNELADTSTKQGQVLQYLDSMLQNNDLKAFQKAINLSDDVIVKRAVEILKSKELPPNERQEMERQEAMRANVYTLEQQNQEYQQQLSQHAVAVRHQQLDGILANEEVANVARGFDQNAGQEGAFKARVWDYARNVYFSQKVDLTPQDAVRGFMMYAGISPNSQSSQVQAPVQSVPVKKETLPNIQGAGKTPAKKLPRSIADIKKLAMEASH